MLAVSESEINKGQAVYTPLMLKLYNLWVLDISNSWIWRCPKRKQLQQFNQYVTGRHLDIGVGTGYYLKACNWPPQAEVSLMDLNPDCLAAARQAAAAEVVNSYRADIFKPQPELAERFQSLSMNYLLHCLPGDMTIKGEAIANATAMLVSGGVLFGATILADEQLHNATSRRLCAFYNKKGIFSNQKDTLEALKQALMQHLQEVEIRVAGCVALFKGVRP